VIQKKFANYSCPHSVSSPSIDRFWKFCHWQLCMKCATTAARLWNSLPSHINSVPSLYIFCCRLKSHLFSLSYPSFRLFSYWYNARAVIRHFGHYNRLLLTFNQAVIRYRLPPHERTVHFSRAREGTSHLRLKSKIFWQSPGSSRTLTGAYIAM